MVHVPSFLVGSTFAGAGFLVVHRDLSHRTRLTKRWIISEMVEAQYKEMKNSFGSKEALAGQMSPKVDTFSLTKSWNEGVSFVREKVQDTFFGKKKD
mmetsp:Transcript_29082/g.35425  ORF Transcript_29082/g.35425 Transcript_29082/m.35425 type:complete len:97 (+) Transcript_29082:112-402(+)